MAYTLELAGPIAFEEDSLIYRRSMHAPDDLKKVVIDSSDQSRQC